MVGVQLNSPRLTPPRSTPRVDGRIRTRVPLRLGNIERPGVGGLGEEDTGKPGLVLVVPLQEEMRFSWLGQVGPRLP